MSIQLLSLFFLTNIFSLLKLNIFVNSLESNFPLSVLQLKANANLETKKRIYFTDSSVISSFKYSGYTVPVNTSTFGLAKPELDCEVSEVLCPQLILVFHVDDNGVPRLMTSSDVDKDDSVDIVDEAGYIGSWPGYCGTANAALIEMYSPVIKAYRYISTEAEIFEARKNSDELFWQPLKVLGYQFDAAEAKRTVYYPFNAIRPYDNPVFNKIIVTLHPIIRLRNGDLVANTISLAENDYLRGFKVDTVMNVSLIDLNSNKKVIEDACGKMNLLFETYNSDTKAYRIRNPKTSQLDDQEDIIKSVGFMFKEQSSASRCLGEVEPVFEFQNMKNRGEFHYAASFAEFDRYSTILKWNNTGLLGYSSWGNFAFAKQ